MPNNKGRTRDPKTGRFVKTLANPNPTANPTLAEPNPDQPSNLIEPTPIPAQAAVRQTVTQAPSRYRSLGQLQLRTQEERAAA
jgi:hypothetical protein